MPRVNYVKAAAKDYPDAGIQKGQPYWWAQAFRGPKRMWNHEPDRRQVLALSGSRAARLEIWQLDLGDVISNVQHVQELIEEYQADVEVGGKQWPMPLDPAEQNLGEIDSSEIDMLYEEMESWEQNMSGSGLDSTPKYEEVSAAYEAISEVQSAIQDATAPELPAEITSSEHATKVIGELAEFLEALEEADSAASGVEFPGMY